MSKKNIDFFENYFGKSEYPRKFLLPIWTSLLNGHFSKNYDINSKFFLKDDSIIFVFGGQLVNGRGVLQICDAILLANEVNDKISLVICGDGPLSKDVSVYESENPSVIRYLGSMTRENYLNVLASCEVGIVSTVAGVSAPSFPSKSLDYMACNLPILAAVESASDFGDIIEENKIGISCIVGDVNSMANGIIKISQNKCEMDKMGRNGNEYLRKHHSVKNAAKLIIGE